MKQLVFKNLNENNKNYRYYVTLAKNTYIFIINWDDYADCGFLSIMDYNNNPIVTGKALVNGLRIRNHNFPFDFFFLQINGETYEPTLDIISSEFALVYEDNEDGG